MKYFIAEPAEQKENDLFFELANFLWDSGHEVAIAKNILCNCNKMPDTNYDYIVSLIVDTVSIESLFKKHERIIQKYFHQSNVDHPALIIADSGIYSNAFPYPHKIFELTKLDHTSLYSFFDWCRKFSFFVRKG